MDKQIRDLLNSGVNSGQPVLSAFVNLKDEDHSFKKLKSLFTRARNELKKDGKEISKLNEILVNNLVTGQDLGISTGLSDVNVAIYVTKNEVYCIPSSRSFNDQYCIGELPYIIPLINASMENVKVLVMMRKYTMLCSFGQHGARAVESDFPRFDQDELENFDNQIVQDRSKKRADAMMKAHVKATLELATRKHFSKEDKILVITNEDFLRPARDYMEHSAHKKSHVVEKHNFPRKDKNLIFAKAKDLIEKNKMTHYKGDDNKTKDYRSLNSVRKEVDAYNMKNFWVSDEFVNTSLGRIDSTQDTNRFIISLLSSGVNVSAFSNLGNNFCVEVRNLDETKAAYGYL